MAQVNGRTILIVDSNLSLAADFQAYFGSTNTVLVADRLTRMRECLQLFTFDCIVLGDDLNDGNSYEVFSKFTNLPPIIVFSDKSDEDSMISAFEKGAVDYVVKPCSFKLLEMKIALRLPSSKTSKKTCEGLLLNPVDHSVFYNEKQLSFTSIEFNILYFLMSHPNKFFTADQLYERIWGGASLQTVTVRKHISSIRKKLLSSCEKDFILTHFGVGYAFAGNVSQLDY